MEVLVWGLFLLVQHPERCTTPQFPQNGCESIVSLGATYEDRGNCADAIRRWLEVPQGERTIGINVKENVSYACIMHQRPGAY